LIIIPITGESLADTPGHIKRFTLSPRREPYDADRRRLTDQVKAASEAFASNAVATPYGQTDLLGAIHVGAEEFWPGTSHRLICLSDFIQDDRSLSFLTDPMVATSASARVNARRLTKPFANVLAGTAVFLGLLQSRDMRRLSRARQVAIQDFWLEFFRSQGAIPEWASDGAGRAAEFLAQPIPPSAGDRRNAALK
jgi:hypothetical protein